MYDPLEDFYTLSEKTDRKYTVYKAVQSAKQRLKNIPICVNALEGRRDSDKITLQELNRLVDALVADSLYAHGH